ncbi:PepSY-associated TM helix domain-containing protein [Balneola sp. MJW-20]|uniref:PepSY-associated TM helix domain-containing protein n=1 Tax=Gracilimonas aurantiaca TaxID=3234185 RepID=UPI0034663275
MTFKSVILFLHRWIGLFTGTIVFVLGLTGCIYVFEPELKDLFRQELIYAASPDERIKSPADIVSFIEEELGERDLEIALATYGDPSRSWKAVQQAENTAATSYFGETVIHRSMYVDPYTAENLGRVNEEFTFFHIIKAIHKSLLFSTRIGRPLTAWSTVIFLFMLGTGIFLWWPRKWNETGLTRSFRITTDKGSKRTYYDLHNVLGFYSSLVAVIIGFTGLYWAFPGTVEKSLNMLAGEGYRTPAENVQRFDRPEPEVSVDLKPFERVYQKAWERYPDAWSITFILSERVEDPLKAVVRPDEKVRFKESALYFDPETGDLISSEDYRDQSDGAKLAARIYDIHTGSVWGWPGRLLAFLASLISTSLPVTGFIVWFSRFGRKSRRF